MKRVLIVDNEDDVLEIASEFLSLGGYDVIPKTSVKEAFEVLAEQKIFAIISDIDMPVIDGIQFLKELQEKKLHVSPFVFVTGKNHFEYEKYLGKGVDRIFSKPVYYYELITFLDNFKAES